jgi:hypothetical protein
MLKVDRYVYVAHPSSSISVYEIARSIITVT